MRGLERKGGVAKTFAPRPPFLFFARLPRLPFENRVGRSSANCFRRVRARSRARRQRKRRRIAKTGSPWSYFRHLRAATERNDVEKREYSTGTLIESTWNDDSSFSCLSMSSLGRFVLMRASSSQHFDRMPCPFAVGSILRFVAFAIAFSIDAERKQRRSGKRLPPWDDVSLANELPYSHI